MTFEGLSTANGDEDDGTRSRNSIKTHQLNNYSSNTTIVDNVNEQDSSEGQLLNGGSSNAGLYNNEFCSVAATQTITIGPNNLKEDSVENTETTNSAVKSLDQTLCTNSQDNETKQLRTLSLDQKILDDEIRARLDKLNALSDLINSLERQFDTTNCLFRDTLKCSTDRLSAIAKSLGTKSIRHGRDYHAAKITVEQSQTDCQRACVQFEQANNDHQFAKQAIQEAEKRLREIAGEQANGVVVIPNVGIESIDLNKLRLKDEPKREPPIETANPCDKNDTTRHKMSKEKTSSESSSQPDNVLNNSTTPLVGNPKTNVITIEDEPIPIGISQDATQLSEDLNRAIIRLIEAEKKRSQSEKQHLDEANKLMIAQENLLKLEREYGPSIRRSKQYFDEAKRFDARLNSVKGEICRISDEILVAKQAYSRTLKELEQFSEDLHDDPANVLSKLAKSSQ